MTLDKSGVLPLPPRATPFLAPGDMPASSFRAANGAAQAVAEEETRLPGWEEMQALEPRVPPTCSVMGRRDNARGDRALR